MPIEFRCASCNRLLRTGDGTAGQQAKCPECEAIQTIPTPEMLSPGASGAEQAPYEPPPGDFPRTDQAGTDPFGAPGQFPAGGFPPSGPASVVPADLRVYALRRVSGPGMALIVFGLLGMFLGMLATLVYVLILGGNLPPAPNPFLADLYKELRATADATDLVIAVVQTGVAMLCIIGGIKIRALRNRGLCLVVAVLATIPCTTPCCCVGMPFGLWALIVLLDGQVSAAFE